MERCRIRGLISSSVVFLFLFYFISLTLFPLTLFPAQAQSHPEGVGEICFPCHEAVLTEEEKNSKLAKCRCHSLDVTKFMESNAQKQKLKEVHSDSCVICHLGSNYSSADIGQVTHGVHSIECSTCHGESINRTPQVDSCFDCHKGSVHDIHRDGLNETCVLCHGEIIQKFPGLREEVGIAPTKTPEEEEGFVFSLLSFIRYIFSLIS